MKKLATLLLLMTSTAYAVNLQNFRFTNNQFYTTTEDALHPNRSIYQKTSFIFTSSLNYTNDPLIVTDELEIRRKGTIISDFKTLSLGTGIVFTPRLMLGLNTSINQVGFQDDDATYNSMSDTMLTLKYRITGDNQPFAAALTPHITLPTGQTDYFLSDGAMGAGLGLAVEKHFGFIETNFNINYTYNSSAVIYNLDYRQRLLTSLAIQFALNDRTGIVAEGTRVSTLPVNDSQNPSELYLGARHKIGSTASFHGGVTLGNLGNDFRVVGGIKLMRENEPKKKSVIVESVRMGQSAVKRYRPDYGLLISSQNVLFEHDKDYLDLTNKKLLKKVVKSFKKNSKYIKTIVIEGHANILGSHPYNENLSVRRALRIQNYLYSRGLADERVKIEFYGETRPKYGLVGDRRVEFRVYAKRADGKVVMFNNNKKKPVRLKGKAKKRKSSKKSKKSTASKRKKKAKKKVSSKSKRRSKKKVS